MKFKIDREFQPAILIVGILYPSTPYVNPPYTYVLQYLYEIENL